MAALDTHNLAELEEGDLESVVILPNLAAKLPEDLLLALLTIDGKVMYVKQRPAEDHKIKNRQSKLKAVMNLLSLIVDPFIFIVNAAIDLSIKAYFLFLQANGLNVLRQPHFSALLSFCLRTIGFHAF